MENANYKGHKAYWNKTSWYHRTKTMMPDGTIKYSKIGGFQTPEEAEESYDKYIAKFEEDRRKFINPNMNQDIVLSDYLKYWFENDYRKRVQPSTAMITSFAIYNIIIPNLNLDTKVRFITTEYIEELLERISHISKSSGNKGKEVLSIALKEAVNNKLLSFNPVDDIKGFKRPKAKIKILTTDELSKLLQVAKKENWYLEILLGVFCGLRKGEICGLKFSDVDLENNSLRIERQMGINWEIGEYEFKAKQLGITEKGPKTDNGYRTIYIPEIIKKEIEKRRILVSNYKLINEDFEDHDYISCRPDGKSHALTSLNGYLNNACLKAAVPKITVHSLRHMYATILLEQGISLEKISKLLGHSSIQTTFDYYCDVMGENDQIIAYMNNEFVYGE